MFEVLKSALAQHRRDALAKYIRQERSRAAAATSPALAEVILASMKFQHRYPTLTSRGSLSYHDFYHWVSGNPPTPRGEVLINYWEYGAKGWLRSELPSQGQYTSAEVAEMMAQYEAGREWAEARPYELLKEYRLRK